MGNHFYGRIEGSRGPIDRGGTKASGINAHVQGSGARLSASMRYNTTADQDEAAFQIGPGQHGNGGSHHIALPDIDTIIKALDSGDPKILKIWQSIHDDFDKLAHEAHPAVLRAERKREREARLLERERRRATRIRQEIMPKLDGPAKLALHKLCGVEWSNSGETIDASVLGQDYGNLRYDDDGETILINAKMPGMSRPWMIFPFDLIKCEWVLIDTPDFFGIDDFIDESGYGWRVQEVAA